MAVASLRFKPDAKLPEETKFGYVMYGGTAADLHHWHFRTSMKLKVAKLVNDKKDIRNMALQVVEALRGDALTVAKQIGEDKLQVQTLDEMKNLQPSSIAKR